MPDTPTDQWMEEFGLSERKPPFFYESKDQIAASTPHAHAVRRAFDLLELDGVLCTENSPLVYFKQVDRITTDVVWALQRKFWNHGSAPILVLVCKDQIHVYSGVTRPAPPQLAGEPPSLVQKIDRVSEGLRSFITSVETGIYFQRHATYFDPNQRVDRSLLRNLSDTRTALLEITNKTLATSALDGLLCRLVFTCYLFDRAVVKPKYLEDLGFHGAKHLRDVLAMKPASEAKASLYALFSKLQQDFNGDLFRDNLQAEARHITAKHIQTVSDFFHGTLIASGQQSFWPYDFGAIPIETISAIYEHFLKSEDRRTGAFYTPRILAELTLDTALESQGSALDKTFLDPACGSGIFLVGLFNRMAEEWRQQNPRAQNDRRSRELMQLLQRNLFGVDINPTACRITAFSLYLAYLDQLAPRDIQELQSRGRALPRLIGALPSEDKDEPATGTNIFCCDFFDAKIDGLKADLVVGNPPWGSFATKESLSGQWCKSQGKVIPDMQIAAAFVWKATRHTSEKGRVCFVLPHGLLFNHSATAVSFQKAWVSQTTLSRVVNLADYRLFLFEDAIHPALIVDYESRATEDRRHKIEYWTPKVDWLSTQADLIAVSPIDRSTVNLGDLQRDLASDDAPQIWKQRLWATPRDLRFLDRLTLFARLRDHIGGTGSGKPWVIAEGFQPVGPNDIANKSKSIKLPSRLFIEAKNSDLNLFLLEEDCTKLPSYSVSVRSRSNTNTRIYQAPHVLITKGFHRIAYADFDVSFRHAVRGIHGPKEYRGLLMFLAAYLRSPLAQYFMFHTSSSWGMYRPESHVEEVLRLPFPFPEQQHDAKRGRAIVASVASLVEKAAQKAKNDFIGRANAIDGAASEIEPLIYEYFDIQPVEALLIKDTLSVIVPSVQPTRARMPVPSVKQSSRDQQAHYTRRLCDTLNTWTRTSSYVVRGQSAASESLGIGVIHLEKAPMASHSTSPAKPQIDLLRALDRLRKAAWSGGSRIDPLHGITIFDNESVYIVKPIGQRHWTETAALNDADEIATTILMNDYREKT